MAKIQLSRGKFAIVNDYSIKILSDYKWYCSTTGYAVTHDIKDKTGKTIVRMHRLLMNAPKGLLVDHINGNKLDNRIANLRLATKQQNSCNSRRYKSNTSGIKGVSLVKYSGRWRAYIVINRKQIHLGIFSTKEEAGVAYAEAAVRYHGDYHNLGDNS